VFLGLQHIFNRRSTVGKNHLRVKRVVHHWIMRKQEHVVWVEDELRRISHTANHSNVTVEMNFYVTGGGVKPAVCDGKGCRTNFRQRRKLRRSMSQAATLPHLDKLAFLENFILKKPAMDRLLLDIKGHKSFVIGCGPERA
jgi:hypothetical protein